MKMIGLGLKRIFWGDSMSKCVLCGRELVTGDVHWEQGLCNECYRKTQYPDNYFNIGKVYFVDPRLEDIENKCVYVTVNMVKEYEEQKERIKTLELALKLAVEEKCKFENEYLKNVFDGEKVEILCPKKEQWFIEQAEKELK